MQRRVAANVGVILPKVATGDYVVRSVTGLAESVRRCFVVG